MGALPLSTSFMTKLGLKVVIIAKIDIFSQSENVLVYL